MHKDDGGPIGAEPIFENGDVVGATEGLRKRDYFAASALTGMLSHSTRYRPRHDAPSNWHDAIAQEAYEIADAMLAARKQEATRDAG